MPCDTQYLEELQRKEREKALAELEKQIGLGRILLVRDLQGGVHVVGWEMTSAARTGMHESCAMAHVATKGSWLAKAKLTEKLKAVGSSLTAVIAAHKH
jgi:hypothetical protein